MRQFVGRISSLFNKRLSTLLKKFFVSVFVLIFLLLLGGVVFWQIEANYGKYKKHWTFPNSIYFCAITLSTVGYGDFEPSLELTRWLVILYGFVGLGCFAYAVGQITEVILEITENRIKQIREKTRGKLVNAFDEVTSFQTTKKIRNNVKNAAKKYNLICCSKTNDTFRHFMVFFLYLVWFFAGAGIMKAFEPEWSYCECVYFCFLTLSTIGYGDFVPSSVESRFFVIFYVITGLGFLAYLLSEFAQKILKREAKKLESMEDFVKATKANLGHFLHAKTIDRENHFEKLNMLCTEMKKTIKDFKRYIEKEEKEEKQQQISTPFSELVL